MNWFIIHGQQRIGPFTATSLKEYISKNDLTHPIYLQNKELSEPTEYFDIFPEQRPPSIDKILAPVEFDEIVDEVKQMTPSAHRVPTKFIAWTIFAVLLVGACFVYLLNYTPSLHRPVSMEIDTFRQIERIFESKDFKTQILESKDLKTITIASNNYASGLVELSLKSISGRSLSESAIELKTRIKLIDGVGSSSELEFVQGDRIIDGEYEVVISLAGQLSYPSLMFLNPPSQGLAAQSKTLLTQLTQEQFEKRLKEFTQKKESNRSEFQEELIQKYLTLKMMVTQIRQSFSERFAESSVSWKNRAKKFELDYTRKYGAFFTSFVVANERQYKELNQKDFPNKTKIISDYTRLSRIAKNVGSASVKVMDDLSKFPFETASVKQILEVKETSLSYLDKVIDECDQKIKELES